MIFLWRGLGFLVPVIAFVILIGAPIALEVILKDPKFYSEHDWAKALVVIICALPIWFLGRKLNGKPGRILIDKATQKEFVVKPQHDFMFIKFEYWAVIILITISAVLLGKK